MLFRSGSRAAPGKAVQGPGHPAAGDLRRLLRGAVLSVAQGSLPHVQSHDRLIKALFVGNRGNAADLAERAKQRDVLQRGAGKPF